MKIPESVYRLVTLAKSADRVTISGRRRIVSTALEAERHLNALVRSWTHPEADATYGEHFGHYMRNVRASNTRADAYAYRETLKAFPNLPKLRKGKARR